MKPKVLIFVGYFTPSVKAGGPVQSIKNLVDNLSNKLNFYIITSDRDLGDENSFPNIETETWILKDKVHVYYSNTANLSPLTIKSLIQDIKPDILYLNSFFSKNFSIQLMIMKKIGMIKDIPTIIAPRGEFSQGALSLKSFKKNIYIKLSNFLNFYDSVSWQATTMNEKKDIQKKFKKTEKIKVANNLTENYNQLTHRKSIIKRPGKLKLIFLSRIHPTKNLKKCLELLRYVSGEVSFDIYGPIENKKYWDECMELISNLTENISVSWHGTIMHNNIMEKMNNSHVFILPTLGENYGHVISEALIGGCPVIISDQTPWRDLEEKGIGWDISLDNKSKFISSIQYCIDLNQDEYNRISKMAFDYARINSNSKKDLESYYSLFFENI